MKKIIGMLLSFILILGCSITALAADTDANHSEIFLIMELIILKQKLELMKKMKIGFLILLPYMAINIPRVV